MTILKVFVRDGISADGMDTAEDFGDYLLREKKITKEVYFTAMDESKRLLVNSNMHNANRNMRGKPHGEI